MPTYTKNLKLQKPLQEEFYDIEVINANSEKIDTAIGNKVDKIDGKGLSTNDYTNEEKEKLATLQSYNDSGLRLELDKKADKTYTDAHRTYTLTHSKSGKIHTLSNLPTGQGIYQCQFIATADYTEGDTFTGYTAKPTGEETVLPDKAFVKGDIVSVLVDTVNKKLGFDISSKIDNVISIYQYSKSGITHNLIGKGNNIQFIPTSDFVNGDTININGAIVSPVNNLGELQDEPFKANIIQNATIQGNKLVFKAGGGEVLKPKITVSLSQPSNAKEGDFWVKDSGYILNGVIASIKEPTSIDNDLLFISTAVSGISIKLINVKNLQINSFVKYARVRRNSQWYKPKAYVYDGYKWTSLSYTTNRLFACCNENSGENYLIELDPNTGSILHSMTDSSRRVGGIENRLFVYKGSSLQEIDTDTFAVLYSATRSSLTDVGGVKDRLYVAGSGNNIDEIDPNSYSILNTKTFSQSLYGIGGSSDYLIASENWGNYSMYRLDKNTLAIVETYYKKGSSYDNAVGGTKDRIFNINSCHGNCRGSCSINVRDPQTLSVISNYSTGHQCTTGVGGTK